MGETKLIIDNMRNIRERACAMESTDSKINALLILTELLIDMAETQAMHQELTDRRINDLEGYHN